MSLISTQDISYRKYLPVFGTQMAYVDDAAPAGFLVGEHREFCRAWPN